MGERAAAERDQLVGAHCLSRPAHDGRGHQLAPFLVGNAEHGLTDLNSLLSTEQNWRAVRAQLASAQVQALRRSVQAYKALGGGWPAQAYAQVK